MKSLTRPDQAALIAMAGISRHPRWGDLDRWVSQEIDATMERLLNSLDQLETARLQGRAQALKAFREAVRTAPDVLVKQGTPVPL